MNRKRNSFLYVALIFLGVILAMPAHGATMTEVTRSAWAGSATLPSYVKMYIYVPDKVAAKPPLIVSSHSCGSTASGQIGNTPKIKAAADKDGFILILPDNPGQNCWDVGTSASLKHDGGGDTHAVAQMVRYALTKYNGDASRVYAVGGSSGAMMTQALMAVYPDLFNAGHARAGVPAGCWADGYASSNQWSGNCANGSTTKTAQQWGDLVRAMYPGYSGHRPRIQIVQGDADATISFKNVAEGIKEWTNVLGLSTAPTSTDTTKTSISTYDRQFWKNGCGFTVFETWAGKGGGHSMGYEEDAILKFFGLDTAGGSDPEDAACASDGGVTATGGMTGSGGTIADSGAGGNRDSGSVTNTGGAQRTGGVASTGGGGSTGGIVATGGSTNTGGTSATGGKLATGGDPAMGGNPAGTGGLTATGGNSGQGTGGVIATGGSTPTGGNANPGGSKSTAGGSSSGGCAFSVGGSSPRSGFQVAMPLLAVFALVRYRPRKRPR